MALSEETPLVTTTAPLKTPPTSQDVTSRETTQDHPRTPPPVTAEGQSRPNSTPVTYKTSGSQPYVSSLFKREQANMDLAYETAGLFLGPMPCKLFLHEFLPACTEP